MWIYNICMYVYYIGTDKANRIILSTFINIKLQNELE